MTDKQKIEELRNALARVMGVMAENNLIWSWAYKDAASVLDQTE